MSAIYLDNSVKDLTVNYTLPESPNAFIEKELKTINTLISDYFYSVNDEALINELILARSILEWVLNPTKYVSPAKGIAFRSDNRKCGRSDK